MNNAIVCFGEVLLRLSSPDKECLLQSPRFEAHVGGAEANVAVSLHRLGHRTRMISALPDSALGRACADELRRYGVDIDEIRFRDGRMGLYFLTHGAGHRPAEVLYDRANSAFASAPADLYDWDALLAEAAWLHVSGITPAVSAAAADAALAAMAAARSRDVQISFDCNFRARLWGARADEAPPILRRLCEQADLIFGDERDIEFMLGRRFDDASAPRKRRQAADAAFEAFSHLKHLACTDRARHSVDVQQLTGLPAGQILDLDQPFVSPARNRRSYRRRRCVRRRRPARPDRRIRPTGSSRFRDSGRRPETLDSGRLQPRDRCRRRFAAVRTVGGRAGDRSSGRWRLRVAGSRRSRLPVLPGPEPLALPYHCRPISDRRRRGRAVFAAEASMYDFRKFFINGVWVSPPGRREHRGHQSRDGAAGRQDSVWERPTMSTRQ